MNEIFVKKYFPHILLIIYLIELVVFAIHPVNRATWWAENIPVMIAVSILVILYFRGIRFSKIAYTLMAFFLLFHTIGGHWTFAEVPFDWGNKILSSLPGDFLFPLGRNNFDRLGHFLIGVFVYPIAEYLYKRKLVTKRITAAAFALGLIGLWAAGYEIIEMLYAVHFGGAQAADFLGSQGDIWDAQKDMFLDIIGGTLTGIFYYLYNRKEK